MAELVTAAGSFGSAKSRIRNIKYFLHSEFLIGLLQMIKWSAILISISAIAKAFCDSIQFHTSKFPFQSDWWLAKGEYAWNNRSFLEMYFFSFISDGWHLFDAIRIVAFLAIVAVLLVKVTFKPLELDEDLLTANEPNYNQGLAVVLYILYGYIIHGSVFEFTFLILGVVS